MFVAGVRSFLQAGLDWCYPPACLVCGEARGEESAPFCAACGNELSAPRAACLGCGVPLGLGLRPDNDCALCRGEGFRFARTWALGEYDGRVRLAVHRAKQAGSDALGHALAEILWQRYQADWQIQTPELVLPIPFAMGSLLWRRHSSAWILAERLAERLGRSCPRGVLVKPFFTPRQTGRSRTVRKQQQRGAFQVWRPKAVQDKAVLLVDDVLTTGGTCQSATRALLAAGAARVDVAVVARATGR